MAFSLGSISPLNVTTWEGFDYPARASVVSLIGDGTSTINVVLQSSGPTARQAQISGYTTDAGDLATLRGYYEAVTQVEFTDDAAIAYSVVVLSLRVTRIGIATWQYQATLVQLAEIVEGGDE